MSIGTWVHSVCSKMSPGFCAGYRTYETVLCAVWNLKVEIVRFWASVGNPMLVLVCVRGSGPFFEPDPT
jgi:hypothetical protein